MVERIFATCGKFAVGADALQWILYRRRRRGVKEDWDAISFVRSTKEILARCMREKGCDAGTAQNLLAGLPDTFDTWKAAQAASNGFLGHGPGRGRQAP